MHVQMRGIAMHHEEHLTLTRGDLGQRFLGDGQRLLGSQLIGRVLIVPGKETHYCVDKMVLRRLLAATRLCRKAP
ncbi:hypothetical protein D9M68_925940 [compost metagenome]